MSDSENLLRLARLADWHWQIEDDRFSANPLLADLLCIERPVFEGIKSFIDLFSHQDRQRVSDCFTQAGADARSFELELEWKGAAESPRYLHIVAQVNQETPGKPVSVSGYVQDISSIRRDEDIILHQAYYDPLTDLPNLLLLKERLSHAVHVAQQANSQLAVVLLGIDRIQIINASFGHEQSKQLWLEFARFLKQCLPQGDTLARISDNDFVILLESINDVEQVQGYLKTIRESLKSAPLNLIGEQLHVSMSMGVAIFPDDASDSDSLLKSANIAMRKARARGGDQECFYSHNLNQRVHDRMKLEKELRLALNNQQIEILYQPQQSLQNNEIVGVESLLRWKHPKHGVLSPSRFIPLAEESGLITELGAYVMEQVLAQALIWYQQGHLLRVGINLSALQFSQVNLVSQIKLMLEKYPVQASLIDLEITETIAMQDAEATNRQMHELKTLGVQLSMDDFGTGYSSLAYLHQFPLDTIKIDRSFIRTIKDNHNGTITRAVIAMAHGLGMEVIAEGVENELQREFLKQNNCQYIQGYIISEPLTAVEFEAFLAERNG